MSERVINDPAAGGWELNPATGYWMWSGGGGSIQDGDTEGQITTWDGTEWTPEGAVVVADGKVGINADAVTQGGEAPLKVYSESGSQLALAKNGGGAGISLGSEDTTYGLVEASAGGGLSLWAGDGSLSKALDIDANGNVNITGKLFVNGEEVTAGGGGLPDGDYTHNGKITATDFIAEGN